MSVALWGLLDLSPVGYYGSFRAFGVWLAVFRSGEDLEVYQLCPLPGGQLG